MKKYLAASFCLLLICAGCLPSGAEVTLAPTLATPAATAAVPTQTPAGTPTREPTPASTPVPTPTINPEDVYFSKTEEIYIAPDHNLYTYKTSSLSIRIERFNDPSIPLCWLTAEIRTRGEEFFNGYAKNKLGGLEQPVAIARRNSAVFGINTDFFTLHDKGVILRGGQVLRDNPNNDVLALFSGGNMAGYFKGETTGAALSQNGAVLTYDFGPVLVQNGEKTKDFRKRSNVSGRNPRCGIGMVKPGHYVAILVDGRQPGVSVGVSLDSFADMFLVYGCQVAYNMDGGQSTAMVFMGELIHSHDNDQTWPGMRRLSELLMIGKSQQVPPLK